MGQLSRAERDLLEKLMKARESRDGTVKQSKVGAADRLPPKIAYMCDVPRPKILPAHMHVLMSPT